uniref:Uncharacterized protein n=1 Tax=Leucosporidium scottii TaxID=5278 RepID=A0A0H5FUL0_9BASI|nr:hypothetical protein [Leucosporidium scottii]
MDRRFKPAISASMLADRFESYVGALWACRGSGTVLEFLAPIFAKEMLKVAREDVEEQESRAEKKGSVKGAPALVSPKIPSKPKEDSSTPPISSAEKKNKKSAYTTPLSYATLDEAKAKFVEDLKKGGWESSFHRGKGSMTFAPGGSKRLPARVSFASGQDGLGLLLRRAVVVGLVEVRNLAPLPPRPTKKQRRMEAQKYLAARMEEKKAEKKAEQKQKRVETLIAQQQLKAKSSAPKPQAKKPKLSVRGVIAEKEPSGKQKSSKKPSAKLSPPSSSPAPLINPSFFL